MIGIAVVLLATISADDDRYAWLFLHLDRDTNGVLDATDFAAMPAPIQQWFTARNIRPELDSVAIAKLAPQLLAALRNNASPPPTRPPAGRLVSAEFPVPQPLPGHEPEKKRQPSDELPANFRALDTNGDGQISLTELGLARHEEFLRLDQDNDGFLTPRELGSPPPMKPVVAVAPRAEAERLFTQRARMVFRLADRDRDGVLSASEWNNMRGGDIQSRKLKPPTFPISATEFAQLYLQAHPADEP